MTDRTTYLHAPFIVTAAVVILAIGGCGKNDSKAFMTSAQSYLAKADYPAAIIELKNALRESPNDPQVRFLLARALLDSGDPIAAITEFRKALELKYPGEEVYPLLARAMVQAPTPRKELLELANFQVTTPHAKAEVAAALANAYIGLGQPKDARGQIESALALEPGNVNAQIAAAQLAVVEKNYPGAVQLLDAVLVSIPDNTEALLLKGDLSLAMGRPAEAIKAFERVVEIRPQMTRARYTLASTYIQLKQLDKAGVHVAALKKAAPGDPRTQYSIGFLAFAQGDNATAIDAVQKAVQAAPEFLPARYLSGLVDMQRGAYGAAEHSLRMVVAQVPGDNGARIALAETYLRRGMAVRAMETLEPTLRNAPDNTVALRLAGEIQLRLSQPAKSVEFLEKANALDKGDMGVRVRLAEVKLAQGDSNQGLKELEALSAAEPDKREPDAALISAHLRARDFAKAMAVADAMVKKQPTSATALHTKATVHMAMGDLKNARIGFDKALSLNPNLDVAAFNLARIEVAERNYAGAKKRYDELLAKDPKSERVLLGLAEVLIASGAPPAEVVTAIQRAVASSPDSALARLALINYLARQKDWKAALAAAQAAQAAVPDMPQILEALASVQQASGELNQAIETYSRLAKFQPDNPLPLMRIAGIQAQFKNYPASIAALRSAMTLAPDNPTIWVALAAAYMESNQPDAGFAEAKRLQKAQPSRAAGFVLEAELLAAQKKLPEAVAAYKTALAKQALPFIAVRTHSALVLTGKTDDAAALAQKWVKDHPKDTQVRAYLGQQSLNKGDFKAAAAYYRPVIELEPENVALLNNLAWSLSEMNDPTALGYAERAYRLAPGVPEVANTYGWILVQKGDMTRGLELLRRAVELAPADAQKRLRLAQALIKGGDKPAARKELEIVAKADSVAARTQAEQMLKDL